MRGFFALNGILFIISAPSGAGKTSLVKALIQSMSDIAVSVSHTTRLQRKGEIDGADYHFVTQDVFLGMVDRGEFIEHAQVYGNYYGTSKVAVERQLRAGQNIILEIDWQGMQQVKCIWPESVSIFVLPPSRSALESRLMARGQDDDTVIAQRMAQARDEMLQYKASDYLLVNDDFDETLKNLLIIVESQSFRTSHQTLRNRNLLAELLL